MKKILLLLLIFVFGCTGAFAQQFDYGKIAPHPRLLLPEGGEEAIKKAIAEYPPLAAVHQRIMELCDRTLTEPPVERIKEGKRLLAISRIALKRIYYLSYAYRMTGDKKYAHRAEQEMLAVSRFTDWNPTHFLDVGEMVMALAIGYDWLYDSLQPDTRRVVREAIIEKDLMRQRIPVMPGSTLPRITGIPYVIVDWRMVRWLFSKRFRRSRKGLSRNAWRQIRKRW